ncbi:unnamed protein product [Rotaria sp. Silwood1]|nr:unnamed protein product [Rotaria sp. Silwood1]
MDMTSCHSSLPIKNESVPCSSDSEDDQATAADVDANMDYYDARSFKQQNICRKNQSKPKIFRNRKRSCLSTSQQYRYDDG